VSNSVSPQFLSTIRRFNGSQNSRLMSRFNSTKSHGNVLNRKYEGIARIDENISMEYPDNGGMPRSPLAQGRGGMHFKRTLAQFSLEDTVTVVTGGASGIGLAICQATMASGSHIAIVDMNRKLLATL
jgi:hypothetical protein